MPTPLCFILIPLNKKKDATGREIDFDAVYERLIAPAVREAGMEPVREDEERRAGIIHKPMLERLILCEYAVADLTIADADLFYELGVRHAVKPNKTVLLFAEGSGQLPFDVSHLRAIPYGISPAGMPTDEARYLALLAVRLKEARKAPADSPLFRLVDNYPQVDHARTDIFRDLVEYSNDIKERLARARKAGLNAVLHVEAELGNIADCETGVVIDLLLSYRAVKGWDEMVALTAKMPPMLAATVMVREQLGLALNRAGRGEEAEQVLLDLIARRGPSSESCSILGRVYKERWESAKISGSAKLAEGALGKAIDAYLKGFEADWRDAYPGINALTLMELKEPPDPRRLEILPVVTYAVKRRVSSGTPDYWDFATLLELAVLAGDEAGARDALVRALDAVREPWEPETTLRTLRLVREARERRGEANPAWIAETEAELMKATKHMPRVLS